MNFIRKLLKRVFNRVTVCVIGILLQIGYLVSVFWTLGTLYTYSYVVFVLIGVVTAAYIVNSGMNPGYKIAWIMVVLIIPIFGVMLYVFFGNSHSGDRLRKRMNSYSDECRLLLPQNSPLIDALGSDDFAARKQANYLYRFGGYPVYSNTQTRYFSSGEEKFEAMLREIKAAKRFVFLEYFIIEEGTMWDTLLEVLAQKAAEGVDIRVIYDDIGCLFTLPFRYGEKLEKLGIKCRVFNPFKPIWSAKMNNRDHRKICVVDGHTAFTGGVNLADEYINAREKHGHWKDSAVMLKGEAVWSFTMMFFTMWNYLDGSRPEHYDEYRPRSEDIAEYKGDALVVPFTDSPLDDEPVGENVYLNMITEAKDYVYITTPYLITDNEMTSALILAAKSGVDVRIITPHIPDKRFVHAVTRAYYKKLTACGVKIYEYTPGFIHAKTIVCDDKTAMVGTINLDFRSLYLHFECAAWMYKADCVKDVRDDFLAVVAKSREVTYADCKSVNVFVRTIRAFLMLFAPLM